MATHLLEVKDLHTSFNVPSGEVKSVNGISFTLDKHEVLGIVGESGSGKSVTAYSIMQILEKPGRVIGGSIKFNGQEMLNILLKQMQKIRGSKIAIIFQDSMTSLNPVWSIGNQLMECVKTHTDIPEYAALKEKVNSLKKKLLTDKENKKAIFAELKAAVKEYKAYPRKRSLEMLRLVGINEPEKRLKQYPFEFSGGMLQRVMIAMSLICEPDLIIADEPTTALDVTIQAQILELLISIQKKMGMGIIMITHDLGVVAQICDKINVMYAGRIVESGTCNDIFYNPKHEYTKGLINSIPKADKKRGEKLKPIPGNPVDVFRLPNGCSFVPRCEKCMKVCLKKYPNFIDVDEHHKTACFAYLQELVDQNKITPEEFDKYLEGCKSGNTAYKKASLYDIDYAKKKYLKALEEYEQRDETKLTQDEIDVLKFRVNEFKNGLKRAKKDFKISVRNYFQSRSERKSIDRNDVGKKVAHQITQMKSLANTFTNEDFDKCIADLVISTTAINEQINKEDVINAKVEYKKSAKLHRRNLFKKDVELHNAYYVNKFKYYSSKDEYAWKIYVNKRKARCIRKLTKIFLNSRKEQTNYEEK